MKIKHLLATIVLIATQSQAQPSILFDACNGLQDSNKRKTCFQQLLDRQQAGSTALAKVQVQFAALKDATESGLNLKNYTNLNLELLKLMAALKEEQPGPAPGKIRGLEAAALAYKDAEVVWLEALRSGKSWGLGRNLAVEPAYTGLNEIVLRYGLELYKGTDGAEVLLLNSSLTKIWGFAQLEVAEAKETSKLRP